MPPLCRLALTWGFLTAVSGRAAPERLQAAAPQHSAVAAKLRATAGGGRGPPARTSPPAGGGAARAAKVGEEPRVSVAAVMKNVEVKPNPLHSKTQKKEAAVSKPQKPIPASKRIPWDAAEKKIEKAMKVRKAGLTRSEGDHPSHRAVNTQRAEANNVHEAASKSSEKPGASKEAVTSGRHTKAEEHKAEKAASKISAWAATLKDARHVQKPASKSTEGMSTSTAAVAAKKTKEANEHSVQKAASKNSAGPSTHKAVVTAKQGGKAEAHKMLKAASRRSPQGAGTSKAAVAQKVVEKAEEHAVRTNSKGASTSKTAVVAKKSEKAEEHKVEKGASKSSVGASNPKAVVPARKSEKAEAHEVQQKSKAEVQKIEKSAVKNSEKVHPSKSPVNDAPKVEAPVRTNQLPSVKPVALNMSQNATRRPLRVNVGNMTGAAPVHLLGDDMCTCNFQRPCTCKDAMLFLDCVSKACGSGKCDCDGGQYLNTCSAMGQTCPDLDFKCSSNKAVCSVEGYAVEKTKEEKERRHAPAVETAEDILNDLREMKEQKCRFEQAARDGWVNADNRVQALEAVIYDRMRDLADKDHLLPDMHCYHHFEEWKAVPVDWKKEQGGGIRAVMGAPVLALALGGALLLA